MADALPPFELQGHDLLEVYTHKSLRQEDSDGHKLAFLGERLLNSAIARHWYENLPGISSQELQERTEQTLSDDLLQACMDKYELRSKLVRTPEYNDIGPDDVRDFLNVYIGALYGQASVSGVQRWVSILIDPNGSPPYSPLPGTTTMLAPLTAPLPPNPAPPLPPVPGTPSLPPYSPPAPPTSINASSSLVHVTLSRFNEHAQRLGYDVSWESSHSGEAHRILWTLTVCLNGQPRGTGQASSQKAAKEQAIREAWTNMGWDVSGPSSVNSPQPLLQPLSPLSSTVPLQSPPSMNAFAASTSGDNLSSVTLAWFNEVAAKQHLQVSWEHSSTGDPHMSTWHSTCMVDGARRGSGTGRTKKEAILVAVRDAWRNLGWS